MKIVYCEWIHGCLEGTSKLHANVAHIPMVPSLNTLLSLCEPTTTALHDVSYVQLIGDPVNQVWAWRIDGDAWFCYH